MSNNYEAFKKAVEILDSAGRSWRPWRFYSETNPNLALTPENVKGVQYGYINVADMPLDGDPEQPRRVIQFSNAAFDATNARLAAALALCQTDVKPGKAWYERLMSRLQAEQPKQAVENLPATEEQHLSAPKARRR